MVASPREPFDVVNLCFENINEGIILLRNIKLILSIKYVVASNSGQFSDNNDYAFLRYELANKTNILLITSVI